MMKQITTYTCMLIMLLSTISVYAQEESYTISRRDSLSITAMVDSIGYVKASDSKDNWHISLGVGSSILLAESDRRGPLSGRFAPAVDLSVGKWVIPSVGFRVQYSGWKARGYVNEDHMTDTAYGELVNGHWYKQKFDYHHIMGHAMINMMNAIGEYREDRLYTISPYVGLGLIGSPDIEMLELTGTFGLLNNFRLSPSFDIILDVKGSIMHDRFDGETESVPNKTMEGLATMVVGLSYKFKPRGWRSTKVNILNVDHAAEANYQRLLAQAEQEKQDILNQVQVEPTPAPVPEPIIIKETVLKIVTAPIFFDLNKWDITNRERIKLSYIAEYINGSPEDKRFKVVGCADMQTGNPTINERLSRNRANSVYTTLINEFGVDEGRLEMEHRGGVDYMFLKDNELSRVVIFED